MKSDRSATQPERSVPALVIRIGGFRMTLERVPARLLTVLMTCRVPRSGHGFLPDDRSRKMRSSSRIGIAADSELR